MNWRQVAENWPAFVEVISNRWPRTDEAKLAAMDGDRERLEAHLSASHDLTRAEACDEIESWLMGAIPADVAMSNQRDSQSASASAWQVPAGEDVYPEDRDFGDGRAEGRPTARSGRG